jgi:hypothetical protein
VICEHQCGWMPGLAVRPTDVNCHLNIVSLNKPKVLTGLNQKVCGRMLPYMVGAHGQQSHRWIGRVYPARVTYAEHGKPVPAPFGAGEPQGTLWQVWVKDCRESESYPAIGWIRVEPLGDITLRESGQTSTRSFMKRALRNLYRKESR